MLKMLDNTIHDVNKQHIQQGFADHKIIINAKIAMLNIYLKIMNEINKDCNISH